MNLGYGIHLPTDNYDFQLYSAVLSIKSAHLFLKDRVSKIFIYTNMQSIVSQAFSSYFSEELLAKIQFETDTNLVDRLRIYCTQWIDDYSDAGIFYKLQIIYEKDDVLYLDTDTIFGSGVLDIPSSHKEILKPADGSYAMYVEKNLDDGKLIYFIEHNKLLLAELKKPDEIIRDRLADSIETSDKVFRSIHHFGTSAATRRPAYNAELFAKLNKYLDSYYEDTNEHSFNIDQFKDFFIVQKFDLTQLL